MGWSIFGTGIGPKLGEGGEDFADGNAMRNKGGQISLSPGVSAGLDEAVGLFVGASVLPSILTVGTVTIRTGPPAIIVGVPRTNSISKRSAS